jgi:hypothetical protein|tara:strand:- start:1175 stop:1372 length:198 start_codon:yes stop_codon:yes gene_type:complete
MALKVDLILRIIIIFDKYIMLEKLSNYALRSILTTYNNVNRKNVYFGNIHRMPKYKLIYCIKILT